LSSPSTGANITIYSDIGRVVNFIIIGGGGGGGNGDDGGTGGNGGNGGKVVNGSLNLPIGSTTFNCTIGTGGAGGVTNTPSSPGSAGLDTKVSFNNTVTVNSYTGGGTSYVYLDYIQSLISRGGSQGKGGAIANQNAANAATAYGAGAGGLGLNNSSTYSNSSTVLKGGVGTSFDVNGTTYNFSGGGCGARGYDPTSATTRYNNNPLSNATTGGGLGAYLRADYDPDIFFAATTGQTNTGGGGGGGMGASNATNRNYILSISNGAAGGSGIIILYIT